MPSLPIELDNKLREIDSFRRDLTIETQLKNQQVTFFTTWGLFSPRNIDDGTRLLLDHLDISPDENIIDLGCGYGPIGITLAKIAHQGNTLMLDKDFVAVEYSQRNIQHNQLSNCKAMLSNGLSAISEHHHYSLLVSNIPAKVGNEMLYIYLADALKCVRPGGKVVVVTINGLRNFIKRSFNEMFGNYKKVKQGKNYTISSAILP
ncbi:MAG: methyltransferase [Pseudomonadota bacterium]